MGDRDYNDYDAPRDRSPYRGTPSTMRSETPAGRVYVGNLPSHANQKMLEDLFNKYGRVVDVSVKKTISGAPFAFVEFQDPADARDAIRERDGFKLDGKLLRVEPPLLARGPRGMRNGFSRPGLSRRGEFRVIVRGLPPSGSWQDLKDHMRAAGECTFADVYRDCTGVVEFSCREDMEAALRNLQNSKFRSHENESSHITLSRASEERGDYSRGGSPGTYGGGAYGGGAYRDEGGRPGRYGGGPPSGTPMNGSGGGWHARESRDYRGGADLDRGGGGGVYETRYDSRPPPRGGGDLYDRYGPTSGGGRRRSPSYTRRSRSRSHSYNRGYR